MKDSRPTAIGIRRRRKCVDCQAPYNTHEVSGDPPRSYAVAIVPTPEVKPSRVNLDVGKLDRIKEICDEVRALESIIAQGTRLSRIEQLCDELKKGGR